MNIKIVVWLILIMIPISVEALSVGYGNSNNYVSIGAPSVVDTSNEKDPKFSANWTNMLLEAPATYYVYGIWGNGSFKVREDQGASTGLSSAQVNYSITFWGLAIGFNSTYNTSYDKYAYNMSDGTGMTSEIANMTYVISNATFYLLNNNKTVIDLMTGISKWLYNMSDGKNDMSNVSYINNTETITGIKNFTNTIRLASIDDNGIIPEGDLWFDIGGINNRFATIFATHLNNGSGVAYPIGDFGDHLLNFTNPHESPYYYNMSDGTGGVTSEILNKTYVQQNSTFYLYNNNQSTIDLMTGISKWLYNMSSDPKWDYNMSGAFYYNQTFQANYSIWNIYNTLWASTYNSSYMPQNSTNIRWLYNETNFCVEQNTSNIRWLMNETQASNMSFWNMYHNQWESSLSYNRTYLSRMGNTQTTFNLTLSDVGRLLITISDGRNFTFGQADAAISLAYKANQFDYIFGVNIQPTTGFGFNYSSGEVEIRRSGTAQFKFGVGAYSEGMIYLSPHSISVGGACNKGYFASNASGSFCQCIGTSGTTGTWKCIA